MKTFTRKEVESHNNNQSCWIIVNNKVYDVTKFLDEHPGGSEVLLEHAGKESTEDFEDIGHSTDAKEMQLGYLIGEIVQEEHVEHFETKKWGTPEKQAADSPGFGNMIYAVFIAVVLYLLYGYFMG